MGNTIWTPGDRSASQILSDFPSPVGDRIHPGHINELRAAINAIEEIGTEVGGVIRPDGSGNWYILDDGDHENYRLSAISQTSTYIKVDFDITFSKIRWAAITPDETLVGSDITCGASVGFSSIWIRVAEAGVMIDPGTVTIGAANIWIMVKGVI